MCSLIWIKKGARQIQDCCFIFVVARDSIITFTLRKDGHLNIKVLHYDPVLLYMGITFVLRRRSSKHKGIAL